MIGRPTFRLACNPSEFFACENHFGRIFSLPPAWAEDLLHASPSTSSTSSSSGSHGAGSVVAELVRSLVCQRQHREVALRLREALRDVRADFSFIRVKGLRRLLSFLTSAAGSERGVELFRESQNFQELQVVPALFDHALSTSNSQFELPSDPIFCDVPPRVVNPPTSAEIVLALRVLEGCCLLDNSSKGIAAQHSAVKELLHLLTVGEASSERSACLDALLAVMLDCPTNQKEFEHLLGVHKVAEFILNRDVEHNLRMRSAEFLLLLVGDVYGCDALQEIITECLGAECSSIVIDVYSRLDSSSSDLDRKSTSLHTLAQQILDTLG